MRVKYDLGLFDDPYRYLDEKREASEVMTPENLAIARDVARKSMVLLKNEKNILPLNNNLNVAVIGPLADDAVNMIGSWSAAGDGKRQLHCCKALKPGQLLREKCSMQKAAISMMILQISSQLL